MRINILSLASGIVSLMFFSTVSAFLYDRFPLWILFVLYSIIIMTITLYLQRFRLRKKSVEAQGTPLLKVDEKKVIDIAMRDNELIREIGKQSRGLMIYLLLLIIFMLTFFPYLGDIILRNLGSDYLERFLRYLIFYGILWLIMFGVRFIVMPRKMLMPITRYEVYSTGLKMGSLWIAFPLDKNKFSVKVDHRRGFVEIYDNNTGYTYRLYSDDTYKLHTLIEKYGLRM